MNKSGPNFVAGLFQFFRVNVTYNPDLSKVQRSMHPLFEWKLTEHEMSGAILTAAIQVQMCFLVEKQKRQARPRKVNGSE